jgi:hypothetical protein
VRVVVVEQLVDPEEARRVGSCQLLDPPAQLLATHPRLFVTPPGGAHSAAATTSPAVV